MATEEEVATTDFVVAVRGFALEVVIDNRGFGSSGVMSVHVT